MRHNQWWYWAFWKCVVKVEEWVFVGREEEVIEDCNVAGVKYSCQCGWRYLTSPNEFSGCAERDRRGRRRERESLAAGATPSWAGSQDVGHGRTGWPFWLTSSIDEWNFAASLVVGTVKSTCPLLLQEEEEEEEEEEEGFGVLCADHLYRTSTSGGLTCVRLLLSSTFLLHLLDVFFSHLQSRPSSYFYFFISDFYYPIALHLKFAFNWTGSSSCFLHYTITGTFGHFAYCISSSKWFDISLNYVLNDLTIYLII